MTPTISRMRPIVYRIEMSSTRPKINRITPRTITMHSLVRCCDTVSPPPQDHPNVRSVHLDGDVVCRHGSAGDAPAPADAREVGQGGAGRGLGRRGPVVRAEVGRLPSDR